MGSFVSHPIVTQTCGTRIPTHHSRIIAPFLKREGAGN